MKKIYNIYYDSNTKSFSKLSKVGDVVGLAAAATGLVTGGIQIHNAMKGDRFSVVWLRGNGEPDQTSVRAASPMEAINKVKAKKTQGSKFRAFRLPGQDDESQDYFNSLK